MLHRLSTAALYFVAGALLLAVSAAQALTVKPFTDADFAAAQKAGGSVAIHFRADWCPTCRAQDKAIGTLKDDPALNKVTLLLADYDKEKALQKTMNVQAQSTIVVFKGKKEMAREGGTTDAAELKTLLKSSL